MPISAVRSAMIFARPRTPGASLRADLMDIHGQQRDFLTDVVVELARDARALDLLCGDEAAGQPCAYLPG